MIAAGRDLMQGDKSPTPQNFNVESPMCLGGKADISAERVRIYVYCSVASDNSIYPTRSPFGLVFCSVFVDGQRPHNHSLKATSGF